MASYEGGVFDKRLQGGRASAKLSVDAHGVHAETQAGETFDVPARDCQLELGGASGKMWFCRTPDRRLTIFSEARGFSEALTTLPNLAQRVSELKRHRRAESRRGMLFLLAALGLLSALGIAGYYGLEYAGRTAIEALPAEADEKIGQAAIKSMDLGGPVLHDTPATRAVDKIVERLAEHAPGDFDYHVRVVESDTINAFALPGGEIVVYTGLIAKAKDPDEVAGVLAHEMAHVTLRHGLARIAQSLGVSGAMELLLGDLGGLSTIAVDLLRTGALTSYSRDQEREADDRGIEIMVAAGLNPDGLARMFEAMQKAHQDDTLGELPEWMSSHPDLEERIDNVRERMHEAPPAEQRPLEIDWQEVLASLGHGEQGSTANEDGTTQQDAAEEPPKPVAATKPKPKPKPKPKAKPKPKSAAKARPNEANDGE